MDMSRKLLVPVVLAIAFAIYQPRLSAHKKTYSPPPRVTSPPRSSPAAPQPPAKPSARVRPSTPSGGAAAARPSNDNNGPRRSSNDNARRKPTTTLRPRAAQANAASGSSAVRGPIRISAADMAIAKNRLAATRQRLAALRLAREQDQKKKADEAKTAQKAADLLVGTTVASRSSLGVAGAGVSSTAP